ncbi:MAG: EAL domain-containing protein [Pseudomonadota bacterium]
MTEPLPPSSPYPSSMVSDPLTEAVASRETNMPNVVERAILTGNVALAYQPVVQSRSMTRLAFYEGLLRVMDESGRVIPAREFIHHVETSELGRILDCLALEHGTRALAEHPRLRLAINMSARSIGYKRWHETLERGLGLGPTVGERLILEITESSVVMMPEVVSAMMIDLQAQGVTFAMDDFGAGYTAIRYFKEFVFDAIKIDGQFVKGIANDPNNQVLTTALVSIARQFEMFTVAEFVENADDAAYLASIGIDCLQGYYFGAPTLKPVWQPEGPARQAG